MLEPKAKNAAGLSVKVARTAVSLIAAASLSLYGFAPTAFERSAWADEAQAASTGAQATDVSSVQGTESAANSSDADSQVGKISADHVEDELVVTYENGKTKVVSLDDDTTVEEAISEYSEKKSVAEVQPNFVYHVLDADNGADATGSGSGQDSNSSAAADDARLSEQYYLFGLDDQPSNSAYRGANFVSAWSELSGASTSTVAVLDTGCDIANPDLQDNVLSDLAYDAVSQKLVKDETSASSSSSDYDPDGHGTHVVGEIAATANNKIGIAGAGKNLVKVLPVRVADDAGKITTASFRNGLNYILDLVKSGKVSNLHVVNVSLGYYAGPSSDETDVKVREAIDALQDAGVVTVVAGGNGYDDTLASSGTYDRIYPSDFDECYSVSALTAYGTNATFSDYNSHKDISAPGMSVLSTARGSKSGGTDGNYAKENGTSQAAPLVSSALALLWAQDSSLTIEQATYALSSTAGSLASAGLPKESASAGALNVSAALEAVKNGVTVPESTLDLSSATVEVVMPERLTSAKSDGPYASISDDGTSFVYYGGAYEPDVRVKVEGKTVNASEYSVSYANNVNPGQATVTVTANGTSKTAIFTIVSDSAKTDDDSDGKSGKSDKSTSGSTTDDSFSEEKVMKALDEGGSADASDKDESDDSDAVSGLAQTDDAAPLAPFGAAAALAAAAALLARSRKLKHAHEAEHASK